MLLAEHNNVQLLWMPGHEGIENTDQLAKAHSLHACMGPEPKDLQGGSSRTECADRNKMLTVHSRTQACKERYLEALS
jgi:hypothetical protein